MPLIPASGTTIEERANDYVRQMNRMTSSFYEFVWHTSDFGSRMGVVISFNFKGEIYRHVFMLTHSVAYTEWQLFEVMDSGFDNLINWARWRILEMALPCRGRR